MGSHKVDNATFSLRLNEIDFCKKKLHIIAVFNAFMRIICDTSSRRNVHSDVDRQQIGLFNSSAQYEYCE
jgi:hypothetical protein